MLRPLRIFLLLAVVALPAAAQQYFTASTRPTCTDGSPREIWIIDATSATSCTTSGGSTYEAHCCCQDGAWSSCGGSGGSGGSVTLDLGDDGGDDSTALTEIATVNDELDAFTESAADKLLIDVSKIRRPYSELLDYKGSTDTPDDDFSSGTLDGKWTVVSGSSGTVDILDTGTTVSRYDLSTRPGWLLVQVGHNTGQTVRLRQDYTLPDGSSIVVSLINMTGSNATTVPTNNSVNLGLHLNDSDTGPFNGNYIYMSMDSQTTTGPRVFGSGGGTGGGTNCEGLDTYGPIGDNVYFRIARNGTNYYFFVSGGRGVSWYPFCKRTMSSTPDNIWLDFNTGATTTGTLGVLGVDWIRQGTNALDPW